MTTAKDWLNTAVKFENEGKQKLAEAGLRKAIEVDEIEHSKNPFSVSLLRSPA